MRFVSWLWDQMEVPGPIEAFAKTCWQDVNNGCANARFSAHEWLHHFEERHPESSKELVESLLKAYAEFIKESKGKFAL